MNRQLSANVREETATVGRIISNTTEFVPPIPEPVPVIAEVIDDNGNGFIDKIIFKIQDSSIVKSHLPSASEYIKTLTIRTYSDKEVSFRPRSYIVGIDKKRF